MAYVDQYATARDATFLQKVRVAVLATCQDVMTEAVGASGHAQRAAFAQLVLTYPEQHMQVIAELIAASNEALTPSTADATVRTAVSSAWNTLAGYSAN